MQAILEFVARRGQWLALPAGLALAAAFAPVSLAALGIAGPAVLFVLWQGVPPRAAAWRGFLFTGGTFLVGTYWLYNSIHLVGGAPLWIAAFLMLGLVAIMGSYSAALGYATNRWGPATGALRWPPSSGSQASHSRASSGRCRAATACRSRWCRARSRSR